MQHLAFTLHLRVSFEEPLKCAGIQLKRTLSVGKLDIFQECISHTINTTEIFKHITLKGTAKPFRFVGQYVFKNFPKITSCFAFERETKAVKSLEFIVLEHKDFFLAFFFKHFNISLYFRIAGVTTKVSV